MAKNPWIPAPLFVNKEEEERIEKINEDVPISQLSLKIGKITHPNPETFLQMVFQITNDKGINEFINKRPNENNFNYSHMIKLEKSEMTHLHRKHVVITLIEKQGCCFKKDVSVATCTVKFDNFKASSIIDGEFDFKAEEGQPELRGSKICVTAKIRSPCTTKEYTTISKTGIAVSRTFPPFKGENVHGVIDEESKPTHINKDVKVVKKKEVILNDNKVAKKDADKGGKKMPDLNVEYKMSDFKPEELENPDIIDNLSSLKVLEFKIKKVQEEINKIEGRAPANLRDKILKMKVKKNVNKFFIFKIWLKFDYNLIII